MGAGLPPEISDAASTVSARISWNPVSRVEPEAAAGGAGSGCLLRQPDGICVSHGFLVLFIYLALFFMNADTF